MNECGISEAYDPTSADLAPPISMFNAIWDTGATGCAITQAVVDACNLVPTGMVKTHGVHGPEIVETYLVNIYLPNNVAISAERVTKGKLIDADILIGMSVINAGDFAVTNKGGITKFSFRVPSIADIDFVKEIQRNTKGPSQTPRKKKRTRPEKHRPNKRK